MATDEYKALIEKDTHGFTMMEPGRTGRPEVGKRYLFVYPAFSECEGQYVANRFQEVVVVRELRGPDDADAEYDSEPDDAGEYEHAYEVRADNGWVGKLVWESELFPLTQEEYEKGTFTMNRQ